MNNTSFKQKLFCAILDDKTDDEILTIFDSCGQNDFNETYSSIKHSIEVNDYPIHQGHLYKLAGVLMFEYVMTYNNNMRIIKSQINVANQ